MKRTALLLAALLVLAGCAGMSRMLSYGNELADAKVTVGARQFSLWIHPVDRTVLINRNTGAAAGQGFVEGVTFGGVNGNLPEPIWTAAADAVLGTMGCRAVNVYTLDNRVSWEATYECPAGVDPRAIMIERRDEWRRGITVPDPLAVGARQ